MPVPGIREGRLFINFRRTLPKSAFTWQWSTLNRFGQSSLLRTSYVWLFLVPIAAKAISEIKERMPLNVVGYKFDVLPGLPFSWTAFYFMSVSFAIATFVYSWRCPSIVRRYPSFAQFRDEGTSWKEIISSFVDLHRRPFHADEWAPLLVTEGLTFLGYFCGRDTVPVRTARGLHKNAKQFAVAMIDCEIREQAIADAFWYVQGRADAAEPSSRRTCTIAYIVGFGFFLFVMGQNCWYVLKHLIPGPA